MGVVAQQRYQCGLGVCIYQVDNSSSNPYSLIKDPHNYPKFTRWWFRNPCRSQSCQRSPKRVEVPAWRWLPVILRWLWYTTMTFHHADYNRAHVCGLWVKSGSIKFHRRPHSLGIHMLCLAWNYLHRHQITRRHGTLVNWLSSVSV